MLENKKCSNCGKDLKFVRHIEKNHFGYYDFECSCGLVWTYSDNPNHNGIPMLLCNQTDKKATQELMERMRKVEEQLKKQ